jgi:hypothetical protein
MTDEPAKAQCCKPGADLNAPCMLCPNSPTYWRTESGAAERASWEHPAFAAGNAVETVGAE